MSEAITFSVAADREPPPGRRLVAAFPALGMAGLTAIDHLVRQLEPEVLGHVRPQGIPAVIPFEQGRPRRSIRLYDHADANLAILFGEQFVPLSAAVPFADALLSWVDDVGIGEVAVLHGVPYPHDEAQHAVFHVASDAFRERRLADGTVAPLPGGILDGFVGELLARDLDGAAPPVGVLVTPTHPPGPDVDAALRFVEALADLYGVSLDLSELEALSAELRQQYAEMADRLETLRDGPEVEYPEDRMYM